MKFNPFYEVLSYSDEGQRDRWRDICRSFPDIDVFFLPEYAYLFELKGDGEAHCFVYYESPEEMIIYPFLKRRINQMALFSDLPDDVLDIASPYGYGGYLRNAERVNMNNFYGKFRAFCQDNGIVSEFIRINPILNNHSYIPDGLEIKQWNETVVIDLRDDLQNIWKAISPTCKNKIKKARKSGITIFNDKEFKYLDEFYSVYLQTMQRLGAHEYYHFSDQWFRQLSDLLKGNLALFHAVHEDAIIMSGIFLFNENIINYYLSGSVYEKRHLAPNNLMLYEVALWAKAQGIKFFHLGGGYQPNDSLFQFKASFSSQRAPFFIGEVIHDASKYQYLSQRRAEAREDKPTEAQFFPAYRTPLRSLSLDKRVRGIIIIGASGHARVCLDILLAQRKGILGFCDDDPQLSGSFLHGYPVMGEVRSILCTNPEEENGKDYFVAIGNNDDRKQIAALLTEQFSHPPVNAIHPSAVLSPQITIGHGNFIAPGVIINTGTLIGNYTIINTGATIDHDNIIQDFAQISPGCNLAGNVTVEESAFVGTGAVVIPGKTIGAHAIVGAGAVVIHDIPPYSTAVGVPARIIKQGKPQETG